MPKFIVFQFGFKDRNYFGASCSPAEILSGWVLKKDISSSGPVGRIMRVDGISTTGTEWT